MSGGWARWKATVIFHVQAIMLSIDQYAESALRNREYFLNRPQHRREE
jgi:hypothetical protein